MKTQGERYSEDKPQASQIAWLCLSAGFQAHLDVHRNTTGRATLMDGTARMNSLVWRFTGRANCAQCILCFSQASVGLRCWSSGSSPAESRTFWKRSVAS